MFLLQILAVSTTSDAFSVEANTNTSPFLHPWVACCFWTIQPNVVVKLNLPDEWIADTCLSTPVWTWSHDSNFFCEKMLNVSIYPCCLENIMIWLLPVAPFVNTSRVIVNLVHFAFWPTWYPTWNPDTWPCSSRHVGMPFLPMKLPPAATKGTCADSWEHADGYHPWGVKASF